MCCVCSHMLAYTYIYTCSRMTITSLDSPSEASRSVAADAQVYDGILSSEKPGRPHVLAVLSAVPPLRRSVWPPLQNKNYTSLFKRLHYFVVTPFLPTVAMPLFCFPSSSPRCSIGSFSSLVSSNGSPGTALGNITSKLPFMKWGRVPSGCK